MNNTTLYCNDDGFSLRNLLTILFKRRVIILSCLALCAIIGVTVSFVMTPVFKANSTILLEKDTATEKAVLLRVNQPLFDSSYDWINAEIQIMESYPVAALAYSAMQHDEDYLIDSLRAVQTGGLRVARRVAEFQGNLTIAGSSNSNVVQVSYEHESPEFATKAVQQIVDIYLKHRSKISKDSEAYQFFENQLTVAGERLKELEERQYEFKQKQQLLSPDQQHSILLSQIANYQNSLTDVRTQRISKQARLDVIKEQFQNGKEVNIPTTESSDSPSREKYIAKLKGDLSDLDLKMNQLKQRYAKRNTDVVQMEKQIREIKAQIAKETGQILQSEEMAIQALSAEERELEATINKLEREIQDFSRKEFEYNQISRGINDTEEVYSMLLKQREEARISIAKLEKEVKIKMISPAIVSKDPVRPRKKLYIVLSVLIGAVIGLIIALTTEYFDHTVNSPEELERYTGLTALGSFVDVTPPFTVQKN